LIIGVAVILMFRGGAAKKPTQPETKIRVRRPTAAELEQTRKKKIRRLWLRFLAALLLVAGIAILLSALGVFKHITLIYLWAGILIIGGIFILLWSTRR
jgi:hypothetical protein